MAAISKTQKIIYVLIIILIIILIILVLQNISQITSPIKPKTQTDVKIPSTILPTIPINDEKNLSNLTKKIFAEKKDLIKNLKSFENEDIKVYFSKNLNKLIIIRKTIDANDAINKWIQENKIPSSYLYDTRLIQIISPQNQIIPPSELQLLEYLKQHPYTTLEFSIKYDAESQLFGVTPLTYNARATFYNWARKNGLVESSQNLSVFAFVNEENTPPPPLESPTSKTEKPLIAIMNVLFPHLFNTSSTTNSENIKPTPTQTLFIMNENQNNNLPITPTSSPTPISVRINKNQNQYIYYAQCNSPYSKLTLPSGGCDFCDAGCSLAVTAMILSSYIDPKFDPVYVIDYYKQRQGQDSHGYFAGCGYNPYKKMNYSGSHTDSAFATLRNHGIIVGKKYYWDNKNGQNYRLIASVLEPFINEGWTFVVYARFANFEHILWLVDADENGKLLAYDSYFGRFLPPPIDITKEKPLIKSTTSIRK